MGSIKGHFIAACTYLKIVFSDGAAFKTFTTLNISLRLDLVKLYKTEDEEIKFLFEGQIQKPQEELPSGGENAKSWKTKIFQGADFDQIQLGCQRFRAIDNFGIAAQLALHIQPCL